MNKIFFRFVFLVCTLASQVGLSQNLLDLTEQASSDDANVAKAKREIQNKVIEMVSHRYIKEMIGDAKFKSNQKLITTQILKNVGNYIPIVTVGTPKWDGKRNTAKVELKFSYDSLKKLLLRQGLLYEVSKQPTILPFVYFLNKTEAVGFKWWVDPADEAQESIAKFERVFFKNMRTVFGESGYYVLDPRSMMFRHLIPEEFMKRGLRLDDLRHLGRLFGGDVLVRGHLFYGKDEPVQVSLEAIHKGTGQIIAEVSRDISVRGSLNSGELAKISEDVSGDLLVQIKGVWEKGTFGTRVVQIELKGKIDYLAVENFKSLLQKKSTVRTIRERLFEGDRVLLEVDITDTSANLARYLSEAPDRSFKVSKVTTDEIQLSH